MISQASHKALQLLGCLLTLVSFVVLTSTLGNVSRGIYCHYQSDSKSKLSTIWCHYIDWDFRADLALFSLAGLTFGAAFFSFRLRKQTLNRTFKSIAALWIFVIVIIGLRYLFHHIGLDYYN
jgi:hypothetical protein